MTTQKEDSTMLVLAAIGILSTVILVATYWDDLQTFANRFRPIPPMPREVRATSIDVKVP